MSAFAIEVSLHWAAVAFYIAATVLFLHASMFEHPERTRWALWVAAIGLLPHSAALTVRWIAVGHGPYMLKYEVLSSNAWIAIVMLLFFLWRRPNWTPAALVVMPAAILMMGFGLFTNPEARNLPPTLRSTWLVFHVLFTKLAVGAFLISAASAIVLLRKLNGAPSRLLRGMPELLSRETELPVHVTPEPLDCVVLGTGKFLEELERFDNVRKRNFLAA